jgi:F0F1-type ATP synthase beta subunit
MHPSLRKYDSTWIVLSREMASDGMYPAIDPLASSSSLLDPRVLGDAHFWTAQEVRRVIAHYRELQEVIALLGIEELSVADRTAVKQTRLLMRFLTQPFRVTEAFTGAQGRSAELDATLAGCTAILNGEADDWAESSLYMVGDFGEAGERETAAHRSTDGGACCGERRALRRDGIRAAQRRAQAPGASAGCLPRTAGGGHHRAARSHHR